MPKKSKVGEKPKPTPGEEYTGETHREVSSEMRKLQTETKTRVEGN